MSDECPVCAKAAEKRDVRVKVRDDDYYGGDIYVTGMPQYRHDICEVKIVWQAYQGGGVEIVLQDKDELKALSQFLLHAERVLRGEVKGEGH